MNNFEIDFHKEKLKCHVCNIEKEHIQITDKHVRIGQHEGLPLMRNLSQYACEDCGTVRICV